MHGMKIKNRSIKASRGFMHMRYIIHIHFLAFAAIFIGFIGLVGLINPVSLIGLLRPTSFIRLIPTAEASLGAGNSPLMNLNSGLVGYWTFDGQDTNWATGQTFDRSGNKNTGTMTSMTSSTVPVSGKIGHAFRFDGVNDRINLPTDSIGTNTVTVCAWIKPKNTESIGGFVSNARFMLINYNFGASLLLSSDGLITFVASAISITPNVWQHICGVRLSSGTGSVYINGSQSGSSGNTGTPVTGFGLGIGADGNGDNPFSGLIDDVRIYNRALSATEVQRLYQMGR